MARRTSIHWSLIACAMLASCAGLDERLQARIDANDGRVQQVFDAPESHGLLVIDLELRHEGSLSWGRNTAIDFSDAIIRHKDTREITRSRPRDGLVFFQLPPGVYEFVSVNGRMGSAGASSSVEPFLVSEVGPMQLVAGQVSYVGRLTATAHSKIGQLGLTYTFQWDRDSSHKLKALASFERLHPTSPWIDVISH